jgi:hypothetical protein
MAVCACCHATCASPYASHAHKYTPLTGEVEGLLFQAASQQPEPLEEEKKKDHSPLHEREPPEEQKGTHHAPLLFSAAAGDGEDSESNAPAGGPAAEAAAAAGSLSRLVAAESIRMALLRGKPKASTPKSKESSDLVFDHCRQGHTPVPEEQKEKLDPEGFGLTAGVGAGGVAHIQFLAEEGEELSVLETPESVLETPGHMPHARYKSNHPGDAYSESNHGTETAAQGNAACHDTYHNACHNATVTEARAHCETGENITARQAFALLNARARYAGRLTPTVTVGEKPRTAHLTALAKQNPLSKVSGKVSEASAPASAPAALRLDMLEEEEEKSELTGSLGQSDVEAVLWGTPGSHVPNTPASHVSNNTGYKSGYNTTHFQHWVATIYEDERVTRRRPRMPHDQEKHVAVQGGIDKCALTMGEHQNSWHVIRKGSRCWYSQGLHGAKVLVQVVSVDQSIHPPSYSIMVTCPPFSVPYPLPCLATTVEGSSPVVQ